MLPISQGETQTEDERPITRMARKWIAYMSNLRISRGKFIIVLSFLVIVGMVIGIVRPSLHRTSLKTHAYINKGNSMIFDSGEHWWGKEAHNDISKLFSAYKTHHESVMSHCLPSSPSSSKKDCRLLFLDATNGDIPAQMQASVSALVLAMATDRALVIEGEVTGVFSPPFDWFPSSCDLRLVDMDAQLERGIHKIDSFSFKELVLKPFVKPLHPVFIPRSNASLSGNEYRRNLNSLICNDARLFSENILLLRTIENLTPLLAHNPYIFSFIDTFLQGNELFTKLGKHLFVFDIDIAKRNGETAKTFDSWLTKIKSDEYHSVGIVISDEAIIRGSGMWFLQCGERMSDLYFNSVSSGSPDSLELYPNKPYHIKLKVESDLEVREVEVKVKKRKKLLFVVKMEIESAEVESTLRSWCEKRGYDVLLLRGKADKNKKSKTKAEADNEHSIMDVDRNNGKGAQIATHIMLLEACDDIVVPEGHTLGGVVQALSPRKYMPASIGLDRRCLRHFTREPCSRLWSGLQFLDCFDPLKYSHSSNTDLAFCGVDIEFCRRVKPDSSLFTGWQIVISGIVGALLTYALLGLKRGSHRQFL